MGLKVYEDGDGEVDWIGRLGCFIELSLHY